MVNALKHKGQSAKCVKDYSIYVIKVMITELRYLFDWNFIQTFIINSKFRFPQSDSATVEEKIPHNNCKHSGNPDRLNEARHSKRKEWKL